MPTAARLARLRARANPAPDWVGTTVASTTQRSTAHRVAAVAGPAGRRAVWLRTACGKLLRSDCVETRESVACTRCLAAVEDR